MITNGIKVIRQGNVCIATVLIYLEDRTMFFCFLGVFLNKLLEHYLNPFVKLCQNSYNIETNSARTELI